MLLPAIKVEPRGKADASIIWLHGLGADGHDFVDAIPGLGLPLDHGIKFIFPHAPKRPVTINGGMVMPAWFDIAAIDLDARQDEEGIRMAEGALNALIAEVLQEGIHAKRIILIGFSQGGALALHTALRSSEPLGGVAGLSTYLPLHSHLAKENITANKQIPIFMAHGMMDPVVPYWIGQKSYACLQGAGFSPEWYAYPMVHTVCLPELKDLGQWIQRHLTLQ
ncbi:MAG: alpha/beta hydrolase [Candidatus Berkiellales bacterium]